MSGQPACMTDDEWEVWNLPIEHLPSRPGPVTPCGNCPMWFHQEQRSMGACNGVPRPEGGRNRLPGETALEARRRQWREYKQRVRSTRKVAA